MVFDFIEKIEQLCYIKYIEIKLGDIMQIIKYKKQKIIIAIIYLIIVSIFYIFDLPCVFVKIFGVYCPGCGMTRAIISALQFDFVSAFKFHPMFFTIPFILAYLFFDGNLFKNKRITNIILIIIAVGFLANWVIKNFV